MMMMMMMISRYANFVIQIQCPVSIEKNDSLPPTYYVSMYVTKTRSTTTNYQGIGIYVLRNDAGAERFKKISLHS